MSKELDCRRKVDTVGKDVEAPLHAQGMCFTPLALQFVGKTTTPRLPQPLPLYMQATSGDYEYYSYKEVAEAVKALKSKEETKLLKELFSVYKKVNKDCVGRHGRGETPTNLNSADLASTAKAVAVKAVPVKAAAVKVAAVKAAASKAKARPKTAPTVVPKSSIAVKAKATSISSSSKKRPLVEEEAASVPFLATKKIGARATKNRKTTANAGKRAQAAAGDPSKRAKQAATIGIHKGANHQFYGSKMGSKGLKTATRKHASRPSIVPDAKQQEKFDKYAKTADPYIVHRRNLQADQARELFPQWLWQMECNFSILVHGVGSKRALLERFGKECLANA
jgi:hypothetical protein